MQAIEIGAVDLENGPIEMFGLAQIAAPMQRHREMKVPRPGGEAGRLEGLIPGDLVGLLGWRRGRACLDSGHWG